MLERKGCGYKEMHESTQCIAATTANCGMEHHLIFGLGRKAKSDSSYNYNYQQKQVIWMDCVLKVTRHSNTISYISKHYNWSSQQVYAINPQTNSDSILKLKHVQRGGQNLLTKNNWHSTFQHTTQYLSTYNTILLSTMLHVLPYTVYIKYFPKAFIEPVPCWCALILQTNLESTTYKHLNNSILYM